MQDTSKIEAFNVNTIEDEINSVVQTAHDPFRPKPRKESSLRRSLDRLHSEGTEAGPPHDQPVAAPDDPINPSHYRKHPSGIECIDITRHMNFNIGNAIKYIWRHADKGDPVENLKKAQWYLDDEIRRLQGQR